jgi:hypothetical protein
MIPCLLKSTLEGKLHTGKAIILTEPRQVEKTDANRQ